MNLSIILFVFALTSSQFSEDLPKVNLPSGFQILPFANDTIAPDIYTLAISPSGKVMASGKGYLRILIDSNNDGKADRFQDFGYAPQDGATGLLFEKESLWFTGNNGLWQVAIKEDGISAASLPVKHLHLKTGGEHEAHAIRRGPDNLIYILCGNNTGVGSSLAMEQASPIKNPIGGTVIRYDPQTKKSQVIADGLRNPYSFDFNLDGELFTFDSDNERCISLPWYEHTRIYHLIPGGRYGWWNPQQSETWRSPPWHADIIAPIATAGRGSPTGVLCYRGTHFPKEYQGSLFILDWTFGRILQCNLQHKGSTYSTTPKIFLEPIGSSGFAPTGLATHPITGELFVSIGGRGTKGSVFKIRHQNNALSNTTLPYEEKTQATLATALAGTDLLERRKALEFMRFDKTLNELDFNKVVTKNANHPDPLIRFATTKLIEANNHFAITATTDPVSLNTISLAEVKTNPVKPGLNAIKIIVNKSLGTSVRLDALRILQMSLGVLPNPEKRGNYREGYSVKVLKSSLLPSEEDLKSIAECYPSGDSLLDFELEKTFSLTKFKDAKTMGKMIESLLITTDPVRKIHLLASIAQTGNLMEADQSKIIVKTLLNLGTDLESKGMKRDRNWPLRLEEIYSDLASCDKNLSKFLVQDNSFGLPDHTIYARSMGDEKKKAAQKFAETMLKNPELSWNSQSIRLLENLPSDQSFPALRALWGEHGLDEIIIKILTKNPAKEDLPKFISILRQVSNDDLPLILDSIEKLFPLKVQDYYKLAQKLPALPTDPKYKNLQVQIFGLLRKQWPLAPTENLIKPWVLWAKTNDLTLASSMNHSGSISLDDWQTRLLKINLEKGEIKKGQKLFTQFKCASCHSGTQTLGPSLEGVAQRFSQADLLTAIINPDKDVPNRYRAIAYTTKKGQIVLGLVVYESADGVLLQSSNGEQTRLSGDEIAGRLQTQRSIMPAGLIDQATDDEIGNLFAYLKSLNKAVK